MVDFDVRRPRSKARPVVYFHIGAPKTGTTFLQSILWNNRGRLAEQGILYPGDTFRAHVNAAFDLRNAGFHGFKDPNVPGSWEAFVEAAQTWDGPVIFSQGLFGPATRAQIDRAMDDLAFAEVHLVCTARALARQVAPSWQEDVKNRFKVGFDDFVTALRDPDQDERGVAKMFWRLQDLVEVLERWSRDLPSWRVHIVTVPAHGGERDVLWRRFAEVVGIQTEAVSLDSPFANDSLGAAEATVLLKINQALDDEVGWPLYSEMVKNHLAHDVLANRESPSTVALSADDAAWFAERGAAMVEVLRNSRYDIVGSLDELVAPASGADNVKPPSVDEQLNVAVDALASLLLRVSRLRRKVIK